MLLRFLLLIILFCLPQASVATDTLGRTSLSPESFAANVTGKTLTYSKNGQIFGAEEYLPGNRVRWSFDDGECQEGNWYPQNDQICFVYEGKSDPQCWRFFAGESGLIAQYENTPSNEDVYETSRSSTPMYCKGPDAGV